jgi:hypothetical protein
MNSRASTHYLNSSWLFILRMHAFTSGFGNGVNNSFIDNQAVHIHS